MDGRVWMGLLWLSACARAPAAAVVVDAGPPPISVEPVEDKHPCPPAWAAALTEDGVVVGSRHGQALVLSDRVPSGGTVLMEGADVSLSAVKAAGPVTALPFRDSASSGLQRDAELAFAWPGPTCSDARFIRQVESTGHAAPLLLDPVLESDHVLPVIEPGEGRLVGFTAARDQHPSHLLTSRLKDRALLAWPLDWLAEARQPGAGMLGARVERDGARCMLKIEWDLVDLEGRVTEVGLAVDGAAPVVAKPAGATVRLSSEASCSGRFQLTVTAGGATQRSLPVPLPRQPLDHVWTSELFAPDERPSEGPCAEAGHLDPAVTYLVRHGRPACAGRTAAPVEHLDREICLPLEPGDRPVAVLADGRLALAVNSHLLRSEALWAASGACRERLWAPCPPGPSRRVSRVLLGPDGPIAECVDAQGYLYAASGAWLQVRPGDQDGSLVRVGGSGARLVQSGGALALVGDAETTWVAGSERQAVVASAAVRDGFLVVSRSLASPQWTLAHLDLKGKRVVRGRFPALVGADESRSLLTADGTLLVLKDGGLWSLRVGAKAPARLADAGPDATLLGGFQVAP